MLKGLTNAVACPSRSPIPAQTGDGTKEVCHISGERKSGQVRRCLLSSYNQESNVLFTIGQPSEN